MAGHTVRGKYYPDFYANVGVAAKNRNRRVGHSRVFLFWLIC